MFYLCLGPWAQHTARQEGGCPTQFPWLMDPWMKMFLIHKQRLLFPGCFVGSFITVTRTELGTQAVEGSVSSPSRKTCPSPHLGAQSAGSRGLACRSGL